MIVSIWGFPKIRGTFLGVPIIRNIVYWGLYWGSPIFGKCHMSFHSWLFSAGRATGSSAGAAAQALQRLQGHISSSSSSGSVVVGVGVGVGVRVCGGGGGSRSSSSSSSSCFSTTVAVLMIVVPSEGFGSRVQALGCRIFSRLERKLKMCRDLQ